MGWQILRSIVLLVVVAYVLVALYTSLANDLKLFYTFTKYKKSTEPFKKLKEVVETEVPKIMNDPVYEEMEDRVRDFLIEKVPVVDWTHMEERVKEKLFRKKEL